MNNSKLDLDSLGLIGFRNPKKYQGVMTEQEAKEKDKRKHEEADLHLKFCGWLKTNYSDVLFIRHEKEKARSSFLGNLMQKYNSLDGIPDFEAVLNCGALYGFYIEFKKPGEHWLEVRTGLVKKAYVHQYECHVKLWKRGRCAYFCNDFDEACKLFKAYKAGNPLPMQLFDYSK